MPVLRLSASAEADIVSLLAWTEDHFGEIIRRRYEILLVTALRDVADEPERVGSAARPELGPGVRSYHLRHSRERGWTSEGGIRKPRHVLLYRVIGPELIGIGRVLHDAMEVEQHLPPDYGDV